MTDPILFSGARVAPTPPAKDEKDMAAPVKRTGDTLAPAEAAKTSEDASFLVCICTLFLTALAGICNYLSSWFTSSPELKKAAVDETQKGQAAAPPDGRDSAQRMVQQLGHIYVSLQETWNKWEKPDTFACRLIVCAKIFKKALPGQERPAPKIYKAAKYFNTQNLEDFQRLNPFFEQMQKYVSQTADLDDFQLATVWGYKTSEKPGCTVAKFSYDGKADAPILKTHDYQGYQKIGEGLSNTSALQGVISIKNLFDEQGNLIHDALTGRTAINKERALPLDRIVTNQILVSFVEFFKGYEEVERVFPCRCLAFLQIFTNEPKQELRNFKFGKLCNSKIEVTEGLGLFQQILPLKSRALVDFKLDVLLIHTNKALPSKFDYTRISFALANSAANNETPQMAASQEAACSSDKLMKELTDSCPAFAAFGTQDDILSKTGHLLDTTFSQEQ